MLFPNGFVCSSDSSKGCETGCYVDADCPQGGAIIGVPPMICDTSTATCKIDKYCESNYDCVQYGGGSIPYKCKTDLRICVIEEFESKCTEGCSTAIKNPETLYMICSCAGAFTTYMGWPEHYIQQLFFQTCPDQKLIDVETICGDVIGDTFPGYMLTIYYGNNIFYIIIRYMFIYIYIV